MSGLVGMNEGILAVRAGILTEETFEVEHV